MANISGEKASGQSELIKSTNGALNVIADPPQSME